MENRLHLPRTQLWRGLLWATGPIVLVLGVLVFLVAHYRNVGDNGRALPAAPKAPAAPGNVDQHLDNAARKVAGEFILTAVARHNTGASWKLLDPEFPGKDAYTKASWAKGDIPVIPYSVSSIEETRFSVKERFPGGLTLDVALIPKKAIKGKPAAVFKLGLRERGTGKNKRWLVDYWNTAYEPGVHGIDQN